MQVARIEFSQKLIDGGEAPKIFITEKDGTHRMVIEFGIIAEKVKDGDDPVKDPEIIHNFRDGEVTKGTSVTNLVTPGNIRVKLAKLDRKKAGSVLTVEATITSKIPGTGSLTLRAKKTKRKL